MIISEKRKKSYWLPIILGSSATLILLPFIYFLLIWYGAFGPMPTSDELSEIQHQQASQIYSADGQLLGTYYLQNRTEISMDEIDPVLIDALLAIEDIRFYEHNGIDYRALARVLVRTILLGQDTGGGSTITQQLAKSLYPRENNGWFYVVADKFREMIIARRLENIYSKEDILQLYLNSISFGEEIFGIDMASRRFFNKPPSALELHEAATLTGMLRATSWYNPHRNPQRSVLRRNLVIRQMEKYEMITQEEAENAIERPISIDYNRISTSDGPAPYFREHLRAEVARILNHQEALDGESYNLYTDGLIIHTTLDSRMQQAAEAAVSTQLKHLQNLYKAQYQDTIFAERGDPSVLMAWRQTDHYKQLRADGFSDEEIEEILYTPVQTTVFTWSGYEEKILSPYDVLKHYLTFLNAGFLAMEPETGNIRAWVGGINHHYFKYDHVKSRRQSGSAFKPFVYAAALEAGMEPCDYNRNILSIYNDYEDWMPRNVRDEYGGRYSLQASLARSINTISVDLAMQTGIQQVQSLAAGMGIQSRIPAEPSIALGTAELSLLEMTTAYTAFLNEGVPATPRVITAIYNSERELIYDFSDDREKEATPAISPETAAAMVQMLSKAIDDGTGRHLRQQFGITHALAGKTGTTQNFADGWFVGMTPDLVFGAWVGGSSPRVRLSGNLGYASQTALPVTGYFLNNLKNYPDLPSQKNRFYAHQTEVSFDFSCEDILDDRFRDRMRDFFTGRDSDDPRVINGEKEEDRNVIRRIRRFFSRDND